MQIIDMTTSQALCDMCGSNITELNAHRFTGRVEDTAEYHREYCTCKACHTTFILEYPIFDPEGHINPIILSEDVNDPEVRWTDSLTNEQKKVVISHLKSCIICKERITEETLSEAWFADFIHSKGNKK